MGVSRNTGRNRNPYAVEITTTEDARNVEDWLNRFSFRGIGTENGFRAQGYDLSNEEEFMTLQRVNFCNEATIDKLIKWKQLCMYLDTSRRGRPQWLRDEIT